MDLMARSLVDIKRATGERGLKGYEVLGFLIILQTGVPRHMAILLLQGQVSDSGNVPTDGCTAHT